MFHWIDKTETMNKKHASLLTVKIHKNALSIHSDLEPKLTEAYIKIHIFLIGFFTDLSVENIFRSLANYANGAQAVLL